MESGLKSKCTGGASFVFFSVFSFLSLLYYTRSINGIFRLSQRFPRTSKNVVAVSCSVKFPHFSTFHIYERARIRISGVSDIHKNKQIFFVETG